MSDALTAREPERRLRVLVLSRAYPNNVLTYLGLWVQRLVRQLAHDCDLEVIAPVPFAPPLPGPHEYTRFRDIVRHTEDGNVAVWHPRLLVGPGRSLYATEAASYYLAARPVADRLHAARPFDVIHGHFTFPDGVVGALLGRRYGVPVVITEHAPWRPNWMDRSRVVRQQSVWAVRRARAVLAVSRSVRTTIQEFAGPLSHISVVPIGVDGAVFTPGRSDDLPARGRQILFVGYLNFNKGVDILLAAFAQLRQRHPDVRLVLVGGSTYRKTRLQEEQLRGLARDLHLTSAVTFAGIQPAEAVARYMRESALLVLPSHAESFGAVLVEALACGTPVVSTYCGGPEDIVTTGVGELVPPGDRDALIGALEHVLTNTASYPRERLRAYAMDKFAWTRVAEQTIGVYRQAQRAVSSIEAPVSVIAAQARIHLEPRRAETDGFPPVRE